MKIANFGFISHILVLAFIFIVPSAASSANGGIVTNAVGLEASEATAANNWQATSPLNTGRWAPAAVTYNGYLYVAGGEAGNPTIPSSIVGFAPVNADGSLGSWNTTTSMQAWRYWFGLAANNNYIYAVAGRSYPNFLNTVEFAPVNADGTVGAWTYTAALPGDRFQLGVAVWNNFIYALGGAGNNDRHSSVFVAAIDQSNGTLGAWTSTTSMIEKRQGLGVVAANGYLYALGSTSEYDKPGKTSVEYTKINSDGSLGAWVKTTALPSAGEEVTALFDRGYIYAIGGAAASDAVRARIKNDGSLGPWEGSGFNGFLAGSSGIANANGIVYSAGGTLDGNNGTATVQYVPAETPAANISFKPASQVVGKTITVSGTGFSTTAGDNSVVFGGGITKAASKSTATTLTVEVPAGAANGPISVTRNGIDGNPSSDSLTIITPPNVTSLNPTAQVAGKSLQIGGTGFDATPSKNQVIFSGGGAPVVANSASTTSLTVVVPSSAITGPITVTSNGISSEPSAIDFTALPLPTITGLNKTEQRYEQFITIQGTGFSPTAKNNIIWFGHNVSAVPTGATSTSLTVKIPLAAKSNFIRVSSQGVMSDWSPKPLEILPILLLKTTSDLPAPPSGVSTGCYTHNSSPPPRTVCYVLQLEGVSYWSFNTTNGTELVIVGYNADGTDAGSITPNDRYGIRRVNDVTISVSNSNVKFVGTATSGRSTYITCSFRELERFTCPNPTQ